MSASEVLGFLEQGEIVILRKFSNPDEYIKITKEKVTLEVTGKVHIELWIYPHKYEKIPLGKATTAPINWPETFKDLMPFNRQWNSIVVERNWMSGVPSLREVVGVLVSILESENFRIYFYRDGRMVPLARIEDMVTNYDRSLEE